MTPRDAQASPVYRILALSRGSVPCEFATRLAVDAGMQVIKLEPAGGDPLRTQSPLLFSYLAAGKQSVAAADDELASTLETLVIRCDAIVVDEWGREAIAGRALTLPVVVVGERDGTALEGMPQDRSDEFLTFHGTGLGSLTPRVMPGYPSAEPLCPDAHLVELLCGLYGAIALFALLAGQREARADTGASATVGLTAAALPLLRREVAAVLYEGARPHRSERIWKVSPAEVHRCRDGWVFVDVIEDIQWLRLCEYMDRPELASDQRYATRDSRFEHAEALCQVLDAFFAEREKSCWIEAQGRGVPVALVSSLDDLLHDPQLAARGFWTRVAAADGTVLTAPSSPLERLFRGDPAAVMLRAPAAGEHMRELLGGGAPERGDVRRPGRPPWRKPLDGVRVLELTHVWSGPFCGQVLAYLGAEVIRVENRANLDIHRRGGPYPDGRPGINRSGTWNAQNRGKRGCTLNLKSEEGRRLLLDLAAKSHVVMENFRPGTLDRLDVGFDRLREANPNILLLSLSGYGHTGPHRDSMAYGPMMDAASGLSAATTYDDGIPRAVNGWAADVGGALYGCAAVVRSLLEPVPTARHLDVSQLEAAVLFLAEGLLAHANPGAAQQSSGPPGLSATACTADPDAWVAVAPRTLEEIESLCELVGHSELALRAVRAPDERGLGQASGELRRALQEWAGRLGREDALVGLRRAGVPAATVATVSELLADPRLAAAGAWVDVEHPETGHTRSYGAAIRLEGAPPERRPAPLLGGDNDYIFGTILGLPAAQFADLADRGVV